MSMPQCFHCKYGNEGYPCRNADGSFNFAKVGTAILAHGRTFADTFEGDEEAARTELEWASDCEFEVAEDYPDLLLQLTVAAMDACETTADAAYIAAGLLENSVVKHGPALIGKIELVAARSAKFRYFLSAIWGERNADPAVWARVCSAVGTRERMDTDERGASDGRPATVLTDTEATELIRTERVADAARGLI
jgi:hypothetical protein